MEELKLSEGQETRWVSLAGHLEGIDLLVRFKGPQEGQKFHARLRRDGICRPNRDVPFDINPGREPAFFHAVAATYVADWRGAMTKLFPNYTAEHGYDAEAMGRAMAKYRVIFDAVMDAIADENAFFSPKPEQPISS